MRLCVVTAAICYTSTSMRSDNNNIQHHYYSAWVHHCYSAWLHHESIIKQCLSWCQRHVLSLPLPFTLCAFWIMTPQPLVRLRYDSGWLACSFAFAMTMSSELLTVSKSKKWKTAEGTTYLCLYRNCSKHQKPLPEVACNHNAPPAICLDCTMYNTCTIQSNWSGCRTAPAAPLRLLLLPFM